MRSAAWPMNSRYSRCRSFEDLLPVTLLESGRLQLQVSPLSAAALAHDVVRTFDIAAAARAFAS